jgi:hypothetical protein
LGYSAHTLSGTNGMPRRHRKHKPLTDKEIKELRRLSRNRGERKRYSEKQRQVFYIEYARLCKKYGCVATLTTSPTIWKVNPKETIYTISSHLERAKHSLRHKFEIT